MWVGGGGGGGGEVGGRGAHYMQIKKAQISLYLKNLGIFFIFFYLSLF